jgi:hypothetical protein
MPSDLSVASGETKTVSSGDTERYYSADIDGTLSVDGTLQLGGVRIDGRTATVARDSLTLTPDTVSIGFVARGSNAIDAWRTYDRAGDLSVETGFGGAFRVIDRAGRSGTVAVQPPPWASPPLDSVDGFVQSYGEEQRAPDVWEIDLTIVRASNRGTPFSTVSESGAWEIVTQRGTIGLAGRHIGVSSQSGTSAGGDWTLRLALSDSQAAAWADACSHPDGVSEETVSDGSNYLVDDSPNSRQTVTLSVPPGATIPGGDHLVQDWTLSPRSYGDHPWQLDATIWEDTT